MRRIQKLADEIRDELCSAKEYAEEYITFKVKENGPWANRYKEMSQDELRHAEYIHARAVAEIEELDKVFTPPESMVEAWEKTHKHYIEETAWIRQMLSM